MGTSVRTSPSERTASQIPTVRMADLGLKKKEIDAINFAFDVYDFKGDGKVDGFYIGDLLRACNLNPTLKTIEELGGVKEKGKKMMKLDDFYPIYGKAKSSKDTGGIHDFVEILKLYDKNEDSTILGNELFRLLTNLGKKCIRYISLKTDRQLYKKNQQKEEGSKWGDHA